MLEAQLGAKLKNPYLLQVYDLIIQEDLLILEMEYAPMGDLVKYIQAVKATGKVFPIHSAIKIAYEVASGLATLHKLDIVHRDLKPANILFDGHGRARLGDLGLAQVPGGPSQRSQLSNPQPHPGTPGYMSPEQENSGAYLTSASDVYSLGLILFEMLTGRMYANQPPGTRASELRKGIPITLDNLLVRMLAELPKQRPWDGEKTATLLYEIIQELRGTKSLAEAGEQPHHGAYLAERKISDEEDFRRSVIEGLREARLRTELEKEAQERARRAALTNAQVESAEKAHLDNKSSSRIIESVPDQVEPTQASETTKEFSIYRFWPLFAIVGLISICGIFIMFATVLFYGRIPSIPGPIETSTETPSAIVFSTEVVQPTLNPPTEPPYATLIPTMIVQPTLSPPTEPPYPTVAPTVIVQPTTSPPTEPPPTAVSSQGIRSDKTRKRDGMPIVYVPAGSFTMGTDQGSSFDANPAHEVNLNAFWIDQVEVSNGMYAICVQNGACQPPSNYSSPTRASYFNNPDYVDYPVIYVSWDQAKSYCGWAGGRLPTEAEWEKAARGIYQRPYPWGENIDCTKSNYYECNLNDTSGVWSNPAGASPYLALNMVGNVSEWVMDWYDQFYYSKSPKDNPQGPANDVLGYRVLRGGSYKVPQNISFKPPANEKATLSLVSSNLPSTGINSPSYGGGCPGTGLSTYAHGRCAPSIQFDDIGFRCASTP